jgi:hypothetical protein
LLQKIKKFYRTIFFLTFTIKTWDKNDEYYKITQGNDSFNNMVFLVYGDPSVAVSFNYSNPWWMQENPLQLQQFVYADCGT